MRLLVFSLFCAATIAHADANIGSFCPDFTGHYKGTVESKAVALDITQVACDLVQTKTQLSTTIPSLKELFLTNVPSVSGGIVVSGRMNNSWLMISQINLDERGLNSTTVETMQLDASKNRLMISVKNYDNTGLQRGYENDYDLMRTK